MVHISLADLVLVQAVNPLGLGQGSQGTYVANLGLASGEHGGAMHPGDDVHFRGKRTDLRDFTSVRPFVVFQDHLAHGLLLVLIDRLAQDGQPLLVLRESLLQLLGDGPDIPLPGLLVVGEHRYLHLLGRHNLLDFLEHLLGDGAAGVFMLRFAALGHNLVDERDDGLVDLMGLVDGLDHPRLRHLIGSGLDHDDLLPGGGHGQVQIALLPLLLGRIDYKFAIHQAHLGHGAGAVKGDVRNAGGDGSSQHGHNLRAACGIHAHDHVVQGHVIAVILGEQGTHGPVDDAAGEHGVLAGLSLPLVEAAGNLPHGVHLLLELHA